MNFNVADPEFRELLKSLKPFLGNNGQYAVEFSESLLDVFTSSNGQRLLNYLENLVGDIPEQEVTTLETSPLSIPIIPSLTFLGLAFLFAQSKRNASSPPAGENDYNLPEFPESKFDNGAKEAE